MRRANSVMLLKSQFDYVTLACEDQNEVNTHILLLKRDFEDIEGNEDLNVKMRYTHAIIFRTVIWFPGSSSDRALEM